MQNKSSVNSKKCGTATKNNGIYKNLDVPKTMSSKTFLRDMKELNLFVAVLNATISSLLLVFNWTYSN